MLLFIKFKDFDKDKLENYLNIFDDIDFELN